MEALVVLVTTAWRTQRGGGVEALVVLSPRESFVVHRAGTAVWKTRRGRGYSLVVSPSLRTIDPLAFPVLTP